MLTPRAYAALAGLVLVAALTWALMTLGHERAVSKGLRDDLRAAEAQRQADVKAARELGERNGAVAAAEARACSSEGSAAFNRGVEVGVAICEARR